MRRLVGIAKERSIPKFASETFRKRSRRRFGGRGGSRDRVILWVDTFNDNFHPDVLEAAVEVLESGGFAVVLPPQGLCCGRPLYDWGFLDMAKRQLADIVEALEDEIKAGTAVVGLEPSCTAVFRDELVNMLPGDERAARLRQQTFTLAEFVGAHRKRFSFGRVAAAVVFHGHCHQKAVMETTTDEALLQDIAGRVEVPDSGCCGMAGAFGFEARHYEISKSIGERVLLPVVREAPPDAVIIADGFSCREQVSQLGGREPVHLAVLLRSALRKRV